MKKQTVELLPIDSVTPYPRNARVHTQANVAKIVASIKEFGWTVPILVDEDATVLAGHGRLLAARTLLMPQVPCLRMAGLSSAQKRAYRLADNRLTLDSDWDFEALRLELAELDFDLALTGFDEIELDRILNVIGPNAEARREEARRTLSERFGVPPFTVLNAREGWWQARKQAWIDLGIKSELGRLDSLTSADEKHIQDINYYAKTKAVRQGDITDPDCMRRREGIRPALRENEAITGTSIFDPVLCELLLRWFCPSGGVVYDPFAGGSVRGVVAAYLGRRYVGIDLNHLQVAANREQWAEIGAGTIGNGSAAWHDGNSERVAELLPKDFRADFMLSCPPYADLEVYSDHPEDISNMPYPEFLRAYEVIIKRSAGLLADDSFVAWIVGEARDKAGVYYGFVPDTVKIFQRAGLVLYNEAILVTMVASLPVRVSSQFDKGRKLGKTHQNVLIFCKGDPKKAVKKLGSCEYAEPEIAIRQQEQEEELISSSR